MRSRFVPVVLLTVLVLALTGSAVLAADGPTRQVGLVIAFPDGSEHLEIVTVPDTATTYDVLQAANVDLAVASTDYGPALCRINTTGCPVDNCFCDAAHYWAYYHLNPTGNAWTVATEGIGAFKPADRAVEGFAWSGFDANYNPTVQPKVHTFDEIVAATTPPAPVPEPGSLLLLASGLAGVAGYARYRMRRA
jgi:hypothetical protein